MNCSNNKKSVPLILGVGTQIEILYLLDRGLTFKEIDLYLGVPRGSSAKTIKVARRRMSDEKIS